jgi:uncharacterized protein (TIGR03437 family)
MRRCLILTRILAVLLLAASWLVAADPQEVVGQVVQSSYTHYMTNLLYAHNGDNRGPYGAQHDLARANIQRVFSSFGLTTTLHPFQWRGVTYYNVVALLPGKVRPNEYHVLGAHYDSRDNPGASDDASGVSALLEAARVLSTHDFESSILFLAFDLEERGLIGSTAWVRDHWNDRILSMLNLDEIAFNGLGWGHDGIGLIVADNLPNPTLSAVTSALALYSGGIWPSYWGFGNRSDHYSFAGLAPAVSMTTASWDLNTNYHQLSDSLDTPGLIDFWYATAITRTAVGYLATQAGLLPENETDLRFSAAGISNAASYAVESVAPSELVTLMGAGFASTGATVTIRDAAGDERAATLIYESPRQINLVMPPNLVAGPATVSIARPDGVRASAVMPVEATFPGVFTASASGSGAAAAQAVRVAPGGTLAWQTLSACSQTCTPRPVDFGNDDERLVLVLYATGVRGRSDLSAVSLEINGQRLPVQYAGAQPTYPGLDQVNVELPRALRGRGEMTVTLWVDGRAANPVALAF